MDKDDIDLERLKLEIRNKLAQEHNWQKQEEHWTAQRGYWIGTVAIACTAMILSAFIK